MTRVESSLGNVRHRAELAGGRMATEPGPTGLGVVLTSRVPLPALVARCAFRGCGG